MLTDKMDCGGAETHLLTLAAELCRRGHRVCVASSGGALVTGLLEAGVEHIVLPLNSHSPQSMGKSIFGLWSLLKKGGFDIVHSHARLPSLLVSHLCKRLDICFVTTVHASFKAGGFYRRLSRWGEQSIAVSEDLKQYLTENYGLPPSSICVIPNGVDSSHFSPMVKPEGNTVKICFLSRLDSDSSVGARLLCNAAPMLFKSVGRVEIIIGGGGNSYGELEALARETNRKLGFDCIRLVGRVEDSAAFFRSAHIFVGVSRCAIEAAMCGLSVVLCGNEGFFGRLSAQNLDMAKMSNFCGRGSPQPSANALANCIEELVLLRRADGEGEALRRALTDYCDLRHTARATEDFYFCSLEMRADKGREVLLCGYYGYGNMGDEALLRGGIHRARRELGGSVCAMTRRGKSDGIRLGISCICRKNPLAVLLAIRRCRFFVFGGGTLLQASTSRRSLLYYTALLCISKALGADCRLWGNGIGELGSSFQRYMVKRALACCSYIGVRDSISQKRVNDLFGRAVAVLESDLAASVSICSKARADYLLYKLFADRTKRRFLLCTPKGEDGSALFDMKKALDRARELGICIVFVPMYPSEDMALCRALCREYGGFLLWGIDYSDFRGLAAHSMGVYSTRLHSLLAAKQVGVKAYSFGHDPKLKSIER